MNNSAEVIIGEGATDLQYETKGKTAEVERTDSPGYPTTEVNTEGQNIWRREDWGYIPKR